MQLEVIKGKPIPDIKDLGADIDLPWRKLIAAIVLNAFSDFQGRDLEMALDAAFFLSGDARIYLRVLGIAANPLEPITSGKKFRVKRR